MTKCVLDASAILAYLRKEEGADAVRPILRYAAVSAINVGEVLVKLMARGAPLEDAVRVVQSLELRIHPHDLEQAEIAASLHAPTRSLGLSYGDRACLALGVVLCWPVVTADRPWDDLGIGVEIRLIR